MGLYALFWKELRRIEPKSSICTLVKIDAVKGKTAIVTSLLDVSKLLFPLLPKTGLLMQSLHKREKLRAMNLPLWGKFTQALWKSRSNVLEEAISRHVARMHKVVPDRYEYSTEANDRDTTSTRCPQISVIRVIRSVPLL